jgi:hypothetical protein
MYELKPESVHKPDIYLGAEYEESAVAEWQSGMTDE